MEERQRQRNSPVHTWFCLQIYGFMPDPMGVHPELRVLNYRQKVSLDTRHVQFQKSETERKEKVGREDLTTGLNKKII